MLGLNSWSVLTLRTHVYCVINVTMCLFVCLFVCLLILWQIGSLFPKTRTYFHNETTPQL